MTMPETFTRTCDPQAALTRLGDDRELYREVLKRFFDDSPDSIDRIDQAIAGSNAQELHRAAQRIFEQPYGALEDVRFGIRDESFLQIPETAIVDPLVQ